MTHEPSSKKQVNLRRISLISGLVITIALTIAAFMGNSRAWGCTFVWQACLVQRFIHTPDNPIHEGSPIDLFAFVLGIALGVPIYAVLSYLALWLRQRILAQRGAAR